MSFKQIVIAGAGGYLARNSIPAIISNTESFICALTSRDYLSIDSSFKDRIQVIKLGMDDYYNAGDTIGGHCDVAINFSWLGARGSKQNDQKTQLDNETNSVKLLESLIDCGCKHFIQIGSMAEYGFVDGTIIESTECHPVTEYAKRKLSCANKMREICDVHDVRFIELRIGSMYGYCMDENNIIGFLCRELMQKHRVKLMTTCEQDWEYTHVDDLSEIMTEAVFSDIPSGVYNISNGDTRKLKDFICVIEKKYGLNNYIQFGDMQQGIGCQNISCDTGKIKQHFNKNNWIRFEDGIDSVINAINSIGNQ